MSKKRHKIKENELQGLKYFNAISGMLESLHQVGCQYDRAGNRILHMDQYISLLLLHMFNPICTSLRSLQQASELKKVQKKLGVPRASLGSLSEASTVFDSQQMLEIIKQLGEQLDPVAQHDKLTHLPGILTAVDGTLLKGLPKIAWALWIDDKHKAIRTTSTLKSSRAFLSKLRSRTGMAMRRMSWPIHWTPAGSTFWIEDTPNTAFCRRYWITTVPLFAGYETITSVRS